MKTIVFENQWQNVLGERGLKSFDDFFSNTPNTTAQKKRQVEKLIFGDNNHQKIVYLKRFNHARLKDQVVSFSNFGRCCSQARSERENAKN